jgi:hypothetical protein
MAIKRFRPPFFDRETFIIFFVVVVLIVIAIISGIARRKNL